MKGCKKACACISDPNSSHGSWFHGLQSIHTHCKSGGMPNMVRTGMITWDTLYELVRRASTGMNVKFFPQTPKAGLVGVILSKAIETNCLPDSEDAAAKMVPPMCHIISLISMVPFSYYHTPPHISHGTEFLAAMVRAMDALITKYPSQASSAACKMSCCVKGILLLPHRLALIETQFECKDRGMQLLTALMRSPDQRVAREVALQMRRAICDTAETMLIIYYESRPDPRLKMDMLTACRHALDTDVDTAHRSRRENLVWWWEINTACAYIDADPSGVHAAQALDLLSFLSVYGLFSTLGGMFDPLVSSSNSHRVWIGRTEVEWEQTAMRVVNTMANAMGHNGPVHDGETVAHPACARPAGVTLRLLAYKMEIWLRRTDVDIQECDWGFGDILASTSIVDNGVDWGHRTTLQELHQECPQIQPLIWQMLSHSENAVVEIRMTLVKMRDLSTRGECEGKRLYARTAGTIWDLLLRCLDDIFQFILLSL